MHSMADLALKKLYRDRMLLQLSGESSFRVSTDLFSTYRSRAEGFGVELVAACQLETFPLWLMAQEKETAHCVGSRYPCSIEAQPNGDW